MNTQMEKMNETNESKELAPMETSPLESATAKDLLSPIGSSLMSDVPNMSVEQRTDAFRSLEATCAEIEGRDVRPVEVTEIEHGGFRSSSEKVEIDSKTLGEMTNFSSRGLNELQQKVFSLTNGHKGFNVSFGSCSCGYNCSYRCSGSCQTTCSGSCSYNK